ncbi:hypothetical protein DERP_004683 [Dermatophagoides pteronyssinus]|uniref:Uncharacterized protein n=1 Tax=Dermatophagoides pteronyssinus TaxID=6956 RepID=A0ABQ8JPG2_DERPT|nr:hypothetical protein DERP_004683 [Dermatophagoides pteronyssinus]
MKITVKELSTSTTTLSTLTSFVDEVIVDGGVGELEAVFHIRILNANNIFIRYDDIVGSQILNKN